MKYYNVKVDEEELKTIISSLLFSCSINIVPDYSFEGQQQNIFLAKALLKHKPDLFLDQINFLKEDDYAEEITPCVYEAFKDNMNVVTFNDL
jgi:ABC-type thiamine transport system ATPase subunit